MGRACGGDALMVGGGGGGTEAEGVGVVVAGGGGVTAMVAGVPVPASKAAKGGVGEA